MSQSTETLLLIVAGAIVAVPVLLGLREMARGFAEARAELRRRQDQAKGDPPDRAS